MSLIKLLKSKFGWSEHDFGTKTTKIMLDLYGRNLPNFHMMQSIGFVAPCLKSHRSARNGEGSKETLISEILIPNQTKIKFLSSGIPHEDSTFDEMGQILTSTVANELTVNDILSGNATTEQLQYLSKVRDTIAKKRSMTDEEFDLQSWLMSFTEVSFTKRNGPYSEEILPFSETPRDFLDKWYRIVDFPTSKLGFTIYHRSKKFGKVQNDDGLYFVPFTSLLQPDFVEIKYKILYWVLSSTLYRLTIASLFWGGFATILGGLGLRYLSSEYQKTLTDVYAINSNTLFTTHGSIVATGVGLIVFAILLMKVFEWYTGDDLRPIGKKK